MHFDIPKSVVDDIKQETQGALCLLFFLFSFYP